MPQQPQHPPTTNPAGGGGGRRPMLGTLPSSSSQQHRPMLYYSRYGRSSMDGGGSGGGPPTLDFAATTHLDPALSSSSSQQQHSPMLNGLLRYNNNNNSPHYSSHSNAYSFQHHNNNAHGHNLSPVNMNAPHMRRSMVAVAPPSSQVEDEGTPVPSSAAAPHEGAPFMPDPAIAAKNNHAAERSASLSLDVQDGLPLHHLRKLARAALLSAPAQAVYYANLVYAKTWNITARVDENNDRNKAGGGDDRATELTVADSDALLLARAHLQNHCPTACLRILEESAILQGPVPWPALLIACQALAHAQEWAAVVELLEDACRLMGPDDDNHDPPQQQEHANDMMSFRTLALAVNTVPLPLEDEDDAGWSKLGRVIARDCECVNDDPIHPLARLCCWRARAYHETGNTLRAIRYWKRALQLDVQCQDAMESLTVYNLLSALELYELVQGLAWSSINGMDMTWLKCLYLARIELAPQDLAIHDANSGNVFNDDDFATADATDLFGGMDASSIQMTSPPPPMMIVNTRRANDLSFAQYRESDKTSDTAQQKFIFKTNLSTIVAKKQMIPQVQHDVDHALDQLWHQYQLEHAPQVVAMAARRAYRRYAWREALEYCEALLQYHDPTMQQQDAATTVYCYVATLVTLGHKQTLFRLSHAWVEARPKSAAAWFAVGCYYYVCERYHVAQRHFCRATRLDPSCAEAWIAFGCSFAACDESDQALASFRAAQRLSPGEHTSMLYMGMEYVRTNHLVLAQYFLQSAWKASGGDPLCLHELGVLALQQNKHEEAIGWFQRALLALHGDDALQGDDIMDRCSDPYWEPTLFNLGHAYRKSDDHDQAIRCYVRCVALCPRKHSAYTSLALAHMLRSDRTVDLEIAIEHLHKALSCKPDDPVATELLNHALSDSLRASNKEVPGTFGNEAYFDSYQHDAPFLLGDAGADRRLGLPPLQWNDQPGEGRFDNDMSTSDADMSTTM